MRTIASVSWMWMVMMAVGGEAGAATSSGGPFTCSATVADDGSATLVVESGSAKLSSSPPAGEWKPGGVLCEAWQDRAVRAVLPGAAGEAWEVFAGLDNEGTLAVAWQGFTGLAGDPGERSGWFLDWEPETASGKDVVPILYALHEQVRLCGFGMVPLYVRRYDPGTRTFRPIGFDRLRRAGTGWGWGAAPSEATAGGKPIGLTASLAPAKTSLPDPALEGFLMFRSASSSLGDAADLTLVRAPLELGDGLSNTGWIEGAGGAGWGEFVTAVAVDGEVPVTSLVIQAVHGQDAAQAAAWNRVKQIEITTSSGRRFLAKIPSDPLKNPDRPVVVEFPQPVETSCISIVVRDVWAAKKPAGDATFIGEITARTNVDSPEGLVALLGWFDDPARAQRASKLAAILSPAALPAVAEAWDGLGEAPRKGVLAAIRSEWALAMVPLAEKAVATAWMDKDEGIFVVLADGLVALVSGEVVDQGLTQALAGWFDSADPALHTLGVAVLGRAGSPEALGELMTSWMSDTGTAWSPLGTMADLPTWIRQALARAGSAGLQPLDEALGSADLADGEAVLRAISLLYLLDWKDGGAPVHESAARWAAKLWNDVPTHECRHHLLPIVGRLISLGDPAGIDIVAGALSDEVSGAPLRTEILGVLAKTKGELVPMAAEAGRTGLGDSNPGVRAAAAALLWKLDAADVESATAIIEAASHDGWPEVRLAALRAAGNLAQIPLEAAYAWLRDPDPGARKEAIALAVAKGISTEETGILLANTAVNAEMRKDVRAAAATAIGSLCIGSMAMPLANVLYYGIVPGASEGDVAAAAAAAVTLGKLGDAKAVDTLLLATMPGLRLEIRLAAIEALGRIGHSSAKKTLDQLSKSDEVLVAKASTDALAALAAGGSPACKAK